MADNTVKQPAPTKRERAISAWESAVARTFNPHLTDAKADQLWKAVVDNRESPDVDAFRDALNEVLEGAPSPIQASAQLLVQNLEDVLKIK